MIHNSRMKLLSCKFCQSLDQSGPPNSEFFNFKVSNHCSVSQTVFDVYYISTHENQYFMKWISKYNMDINILISKFHTAVVKSRSYLYDGNIRPCKSLFDFQLSIYQRNAQYIFTMDY